MTKKEFDILVAYAGASTQLTQRQLMEQTGQSLGNVNRLVKEMTAVGLVEDGKITPSGLAALEPYRVKRAIFLAAGFGSRLMPVALNTPKPLVRVNGKRIIDGLLDAVLEIGVQEIYIVRGYLGEQFDQLKYQYPNINFLENPAYNETNNISSAMCARYLLQSAYVLESDIILHRNVLKKYHYTSDFLAVHKDRVDDWCFIEKNGFITDEKLGAFDAWQMGGISYWNADDGRRLSEHLKTAYEMPGGKELFWEEVPLRVFKGSYQVAIEPCLEQDITEIDTYRELKSVDPTYEVR